MMWKCSTAAKVENKEHKTARINIGKKENDCKIVKVVLATKKVALESASNAAVADDARLYKLKDI